MKNVIQVELFGEDLRNYLRITRMIFNVNGADALFDKTFGMPPPSSWVAEIMGSDPKYRFSREFLRGKTNYRHANAVGSRGIFKEYLVESGHVYEVKSKVSWGREERYFCTVSDNGCIQRLSEEDICAIFGIKTRQEMEAERSAKRLSGH